MKTEIKTDTWPNGQKMYETPYIKGQIHSLVIGWFSDR